jgi:hypothetical protein
MCVPALAAEESRLDQTSFSGPIPAGNADPSSTCCHASKPVAYKQASNAALGTIQPRTGRSGPASSTSAGATIWPHAIRFPAWNLRKQ